MPTILRVPRWCIWIVLILLAGAGLLHLDSDFPNHSRWIDDAAKYTDEGWWASGAVHHALAGRWLIPGDYNPVVAVPLWSVVMALFFHFTGISIAMARGAAFAFTVGTVLACAALMARDHRPLAPTLALLIGTSPVLYFFSRMALLEPALTFFLMAASLAAYSDRPPGIARSILCGVLLTLAMLTKSTAVFVAPAILYLLWFPHRGLWRSRLAGDRGRAFRAIAIPVLTFLLCYGAYWMLCIHTHPADIKVFYGESRPVLDLQSIEKSVRLVYRCFTWLDPIVFPIAGVGALFALAGRRFASLRQDPLFGFAFLFFLGYSCFMVWHFDAEPHYFAVLVVPLMMLAVLLLNALEQQMPRTFQAVGALLLLAVVVNVATITKFLAHPEYTLRDACLQIRAQIGSDPTTPSLVIGHGAVESTLFTHIPALDNLGSMPLAEKIDLYHPGWVVTWSNDASNFDLPSVAREYTFIEMGRYPAFDNPNRGYLLLYRIRPR